MALTLFFNGLFGLVALYFLRQPVFALSACLHGMTFMFVGMFVAASAGEILFNKEEADILLHRPVTPRALLWAKVGVLVQVSLWLAGAFNLAGFVVGVFARDGGWTFVVAHAISTAVQALFCVGCAVLLYQLCLRWFGRERLDNLMTTMQVIVAVGTVVAAQLLPRVMSRFEGVVTASVTAWWIAFVPPAWFAGFDDALAGSGSPIAWALACVGVVVTTVVVWFAFERLAADYETGLQILQETPSIGPKRRASRRWMRDLSDIAPVRWWLRDPASRASFLLAAAYILRDRDVKLRLYPGIAPMLVMPAIFLVRDFGRSEDYDAGFGIAFSGFFLGVVPMLALNLLRYSQQWQAADLFHVVPIAGPAALCHGARRAVLLFVTFPLVASLGFAVFFLQGNLARFLLLLPGLVALPVYAMVPCLGGNAVPLAKPFEEGKSAGRGLTMVGGMIVCAAVSGIATWAWSGGWFVPFMAAEVAVVAAIYFAMRQSVASVRWQSLE